MWTFWGHDFWTEVFHDADTVSCNVKIAPRKLLVRSILIAAASSSPPGGALCSPQPHFSPLRWQVSHAAEIQAQGREIKTRQPRLIISERDTRDLSCRHTEIEVNQEMDGTFQVTWISTPEFIIFTKCLLVFLILVQSARSEPKTVWGEPQFLKEKN